MRVYHGSFIEIVEIDLSKCEIGKDFGRGFYVTNIKEQAQFWAERKGLENGTQGFVTEFEFNENAFLYFKLNTLQFDDYNEEWLDFVSTNRNITLKQPTHNYDIVEGPVADDRIATRIKKFINGKISKELFLEELKFLKSTHQLCFCSVRSLQMLEKVNKVNNIENEITEITESIIEQLILDFNFTTEIATDKYFTSSIFKKLANENTRLYLKPWQTIYKLLKEELG